MERKRPASQLSLPSKTESQGGTQKKKYKLTLKPPSFVTASQAKKAPIRSFDAFLEGLLELETSDEVLERLLWFVDMTVAAKPQKTILKSVEECLALLGKLWKQYTDDLSVCAVLLNVFLLIVGAAEGGLTESVEEFALTAVKHADITLKVTALKCLQRVVNLGTKDFKTKILELALSEIHCSYHKVRVECVHLIGQLSHVTGKLEDSLVVLEERCSDADPRVRTAAFDSLCALLSEGVAISQSVYSKASECLCDDSEDVRTSALKVVWRLGLKHPNRKIPLKEDMSVEIRLLDDAFVKICNLVNDSSVQIRALAAGLLGDFTSVSQEFLSQTLDKKLMSHLRVVKSEHERQKELHQQGASMDWETGRKWGGGAVKVDVDPGEISLMNAGACGAFVHGLEDEFMEVRSAAIDSMCRLGISSSVFAGQCLDYLVDMFNDEIQSVRLKSINSLGRIAATMVLRDDQLETVLGILDESSSEIRDALRSLLCSCQIMTKGGLNTTVHSLLDNLKKYPTDRQSIWRCLRELGSHHGSLVSTLVPELLSTHPFFMGKEPDVDDPAYICILILVFNAAAHCPTIPPLFPSHVFRHYTYLRDTLPQLIPHIRNGVPCVMKSGQSKLKEGHSGSRLFVAQVLSRAQSASTLLSPRERQGAWQLCISDLQRVRKLDSEVASSASCAATFIQCQLLSNKVREALSQDVLLSSEGSSQQTLPPLVASIREMLLLSYRLEHCFTNLNSDLLLRAKMVRVVANALSLLLATHMDLDTGNSEAFQTMKLNFQERLTSIQKFCDSTKLPTPSTVSPLLTSNLATTATEHLTHLLHTLLQEQFCTDLPLPDLLGVRQTECELISPEPLSSEEYTRFVSSLALSVNVQASIRNVPDREHLAVQVVFPDGKQLLFPVKASQIRETGPNELKLDTSVVLSHSIWTEPSQVEVCVVFKYQTDVSEESCLCFHSSRKDAPQGAKIVQGVCSAQLSGSPVHSHPDDGLVTEKTVLVISDIVKMNIYPQEKANNSFGAFQDPINRL